MKQRDLNSLRGLKLNRERRPFNSFDSFQDFAPSPPPNKTFETRDKQLKLKKKLKLLRSRKLRIPHLSTTTHPKGGAGRLPEGEGDELPLRERELPTGEGGGGEPPAEEEEGANAQPQGVECEPPPEGSLGKPPTKGEGGGEPPLKEVGRRSEPPSYGGIHFNVFSFHSKKGYGRATQRRKHHPKEGGGRPT